MEQRQSPLSAEEIADLEARRTWVRNHFAESARHQYETLDGKLRLVDVILRNQWVASNETLKLQSLGVTFGDALSQKLGLTWISVEDEHGRDPALVLEGTSITSFPLTAISKRVERGESVNIYKLFETACKTIEQLRQQGA